MCKTTVCMVYYVKGRLITLYTMEISAKGWISRAIKTTSSPPYARIVNDGETETNRNSGRQVLRFVISRHMTSSRGNDLLHGKAKKHRTQVVIFIEASNRIPSQKTLTKVNTLLDLRIGAQFVSIRLVRAGVHGMSDVPLHLCTVCTS